MTPRFSTYSSGYLIWRFDPAAWHRIQCAVGQRAKGDPDKVWHLIDQGLGFTCMEQLGRQTRPTLRQILARKQGFLGTIDSLIGQMGINPWQSAAEPIQVDGEMLN